MSAACVGAAPSWSYDPGLVEIGQANTEAGPDGRLWTLALGGLRVFDGGSWAEDDMCCDLSALAVGGDGTVWAVGDHSLSWTPPEGWDNGSDWADVYGNDVTGLSVNDDGMAWLLVFSHEGEVAVGTLLRFDGTDWQVVPSPDGIDWSSQPGRTFDVGPDGTLWTAGDLGQLHHSLARLDGSGWTVFTDADGVGPWGQPYVFQVRMAVVEVAPDGGAWVNVTNDGGDCDGLARFDGDTWTPYLAGRCISDFDIAPDGSVWAVARSQDGSSGVDTYVITPEAVAGTE